MSIRRSSSIVKIKSFGFFFLQDEIHRRRQFRTRKERLENRRQQRAEYAETQKLFSQCESRNFSRTY